MKKLTKTHVARATRRMFDAVRKGNYGAYKSAIKDGADASAKWFGISIEQLALRFPGHSYSERKGAQVEKVCAEILIDLLKEKRIKRSDIQNGLGEFLLDAQAFDLLEAEGFDCSRYVVDQLVNCGNVELWYHCKDRFFIDNSRVETAFGGRAGWYTPLHLSLLRPGSRWDWRRWSWRLASRDKHPERIDALIEAGCGLEDRAQGDTPLFLAIKLMDVGAVDALLRCGARTDVRDRWDFTLQEVLDQVGNSEINCLVNSHLLSRQAAPAAASAARARL